MRVFFKLFVLQWIVWSFCMASYAVTVPYTPKIINYSVSDYKAGNQNWAISQGNDGRIYIGNNRGLLVFDGIHWTLHKLPNNVAVRSLFVSGNGRIYVGSFEEFGYFDIDEQNQLTYHSLKGLLQDARFNNDDVWTINEHQGLVYFQSFSSIFIYDDEQVSLRVSDQSPLYLFTVDQSLYAQFIDGGLCKLEETGFVEQVAREAINNDDVVSVLPFDDRG